MDRVEAVAATARGGYKCQGYELDGCGDPSGVDGPVVGAVATIVGSNGGGVVVVFK